MTTLRYLLQLIEIYNSIAHYTNRYDCFIR